MPILRDHPGAKRRPAPSPTQRARAATLALALALLVPLQVAADGFNDWPGALVQAGEIDVVSALQGWGSPTGGAYGALQLQVGLADIVELSVTAGGTLDGGRFVGDAVYLQPRLALTAQLSVTLGVAAPPPRAARRFSLIAGVTHTVWWLPRRWKMNWNAFVTAPTATLLDAPPELYLVGVLERRLSDAVGVYVEVDLTRTWRQPLTSFEVLVGGEWAVTPDHVLNASVLFPVTADSAGKRAAMLGVWYSYTLEHGLGRRGG